jgi:DMSO/TMAO reductase YedYZ molybdopterin-dependent catalytic subunit
MRAPAYTRLGVTPRGTDWTLAVLVVLLAATGGATLFTGDRGEAWVFAVHGTAGLALAALLVWKFRRVWRRIAEPRSWDRRTAAGLAAAALVVCTLGSGVVWSSGGDIALGGFRLLFWHDVVGALLAAIVLVHALGRAKRPRVRDVAGRRQLLQAGAVALGAFAAWQLQRPVSAFFGLRGARRRFTGSYEVASFEGNAFPATSWVADQPRPIGTERYRLEVDGEVERPLAAGIAELDADDELVATLDCTGGFYSTQRWGGIRVGRLLDRAAPRERATHLRVVSRTGYRWSFDLDDARDFLLATAVGGEPLSHEHGAPLRLVAPGRRGFQWVKWIERLELHSEPDHTAPASTIWSSFTAAGRGAG